VPRRTLALKGKIGKGEGNSKPMNVVTNLAYRSGGERGLLDVMLPEGDGTFPVVVCIHGGGWAEGRKENMHPYGDLLVDMGVAAVIPNYRLSGTHAHPAQEEDIFAVLDWIVEHAREYRFDPQRIGLTGSSAGGHLAVLVGLKGTHPARGRRNYRLRCMFPVCGVYDLALRVAERPDRAHRAEALIGGPVSEMGAVERDASPVAHVHPDAPPCLAVHGARDELVPPNQSLRLVDALRAVGADAEAMIVPEAGHGRFMPGSDPPEPLGGRKVFQEFFRKHLSDR